MKTQRDKEKNIYQLQLNFKAVRKEAREAGTHAGYKLCLDLLKDSDDTNIRNLLPLLKERVDVYDKPSERLLDNLRDNEIASTYNRAMMMAVYSVANLIPHPEQDDQADLLYNLFANMMPEVGVNFANSWN